MRSILIFILSLAFSLPLTVFTQATVSKLDSLKGVLANPPQDQEEVLKLYNALTKAYQLTSYDSSLYFNKQALSIVRDLPLSAEVVRTFIAQSNLNNGKYQAQEAQQSARKALYLAQQLGNKSLIATSFQELGLGYKNAMELDSATYYTRKAIALAKELKRLDIELASENVMGQIFNRLQAYDSCIAHYSRAVEAGQEGGVTKQVLAPMYNLSIAYYNKGLFDSTLHILLRAIELAKIEEARRIQGAAHSVVASLYNMKGEKDSSLAHIQRGLDISDSLSVERMYGYMSLGEYYFNEKEWQEAINYYRLAYDQSIGINSISQCDLLYEIGRGQLESGKPDSAIFYFDEAEERAKSFGSEETLGKVRLYRADALAQQGKISEALATIEPALSAPQPATVLRGYTYKGQFLLQLNRPTEAKISFQEALKLTDETKVEDNYPAVYKGLARADSALGNNRSALKYMSLYANAEVSRQKERYRTSVAEFETKFKTAQKEAEIKDLETTQRITDLQLARTATERNTLLAIVAILVLAGAIIGGLFIQVRKQREELEKANATKDRLFSVIAHDLRGPVTGFQTIGKIFNHHIEKGNLEPLKVFSQQVDQQAGQIRRMLDNLLTWSLQQLGVYEVKATTFDLKGLGEEIMSFFSQSAGSKQTILKVDVDPEMQFTFDRKGLSVVLTNIISNAVKFTSEGEIVLSAEQEAGFTRIKIQDTGVGMATATLHSLRSGISTTQRGTSGEQGTGLGWQIIRELVETWKGDIHIDSQEGQGTRIEISLPHMV
ncbi:MAG: ATP-binding protein [Bacteroidota bacterium]